jgi:LmbE family N-acetylglucosaminyl deacetylase
MTNDNRIIVLSPHSDDAVWSLGGAISIWQQSCEVVIVTIFDGDPHLSSAEQLRQTQHRWRTFGEIPARRSEDSMAAARLGCRLVSLGYLDASVRLNADSTFEYASLDALFQQSTTLDVHLPAHIEQRLNDLLLPTDQIVAPLGFGGHIDHQLTHALTRRLGRITAYYAEFPYYLPERQASLNAFIETLGLALECIALPSNWQAWIEASLCYRSQVLRLFGGQKPFLDVLATYAHAGTPEPCCRIWATRSR